MKKRLFAFALAAALLMTTAGAKLTIEDARSLVEQLYIDEVPEEVLNRPTVEELFDGLDRYSSYFTPEEYASFMDTMNDMSTVGLGIVSSRSEDGSVLKISKVLSGGAAERAGVVAGDKILAIDGKKISSAADMDEAVGWMQGEEGTQVVLTLLRKGNRQEHLTLTRAPFTIPYTEHALLDGHIGVITCDTFGAETYDHFVAALDELGPSVDRWVLDLRDNLGGVTDSAAKVAGIFTGAGSKAYLRGRDGLYYRFIAEGTRTTIYPTIVLVGENTASAAELLTAALRDGGAGLIIGSRTYGKGVAQTVIDRESEPELFADGDAVRITSARFYSPGGLVNDRIGVLPNLLVSDEYAAPIAYLLTEPNPTGDNEDVLELHLGSWRWYLSLDKALHAEDGAYRAAFTELLEALWPEAELSLGAGNGKWERVAAADLAQRFRLDDYTPRTFADAADSPYEVELNIFGTYGILQGDEVGNCNPEAALTRADLCTMLARTLNCDTEASGGRFADVPDDAWYAPAVNAVAALGLVDGDEQGNFHPEATLTNEQMIVVLARLTTWMSINFYELEKVGPGEGALEDEALDAYSDWAKRSAWLMGRSQQNIYGEYISYVYADMDQIDPAAPAIREETVASLYCVLDILDVMNE